MADAQCLDARDRDDVRCLRETRAGTRSIPRATARRPTPLHWHVQHGRPPHADLRLRDTVICCEYRKSMPAVLPAAVRRRMKAIAFHTLPRDERQTVVAARPAGIANAESGDHCGSRRGLFVDYDDLPAPRPADQVARLSQDLDVYGCAY